MVDYVAERDKETLLGARGGLSCITFQLLAHWPIAAGVLPIKAVRNKAVKNNRKSTRTLSGN